MTEETVLEEEMQEQTTAPEEAESPTPGFGSVLEETAKLFELMGRAIVTTAQELTNQMVVPVDKETRQCMDLLIQTGAVKTRTEAATFLLNEGIKANSPLFEKIVRTNAQINSLREQLRSVAQVQAVA